MRLYLIRHGRPEVASGVCYGRTDLPVAPKEQARLLSSLPTQLPRGLPLYASPLQRCAQLAQALAPLLDSAAPTLDARLMEMDFGTWEMQSWDAIARADIDAWADDVVHYRPGGAESVHQVAQRVRNFWQDLCGKKHPAAIVVAHAGTLRLLQACEQHGCPIQLARQTAATAHGIGYGSLTCIDMGLSGEQGDESSFSG